MTALANASIPTGTPRVPSFTLGILDRGRCICFRLRNMIGKKTDSILRGGVAVKGGGTGVDVISVLMRVLGVDKTRTTMTMIPDYSVVIGLLRTLWKSSMHPENSTLILSRWIFMSFSTRPYQQIQHSLCLPLWTTSIFDSPLWRPSSVSRTTTITRKLKSPISVSAMFSPPTWGCGRHHPVAIGLCTAAGPCFWKTARLSGSKETGFTVWMETRCFCLGGTGTPRSHGTCLNGSVKTRWLHGATRTRSMGRRGRIFRWKRT
mmetsp:Transcript_17045/g.24636  ORF Transcript_17045/g.24636 Transcript_17045/m.24636 type:complete len:262 (-) Transcript_17045:419-1204(-)